MIDDHDWESTAPVLDDTLRRLAPRSCVGHREREPGRLQLRFVIDVDEHMHDIVVVEDDDTVVYRQPSAVRRPACGRTR
jgi:hypothetical protein